MSELFSACSGQCCEPHISFTGHCITNWTRYFAWERSCNSNVAYKYGWCPSNFVFEFMFFSHPTIRFLGPRAKKPTGDFVIVLIHAADLTMIGHHQSPICNLQINLSYFQSVVATSKAAELKTTSISIAHAQVYQIICVIQELMSQYQSPSRMIPMLILTSFCSETSSWEFSYHPRGVAYTSCCLFQHYRPDWTPFNANSSKLIPLLAAMHRAVVNKSFCCHLDPIHLHELCLLAEFSESLHSVIFMWFLGCRCCCLYAIPIAVLLLDDLEEGYMKQVLFECNQ